MGQTEEGLSVLAEALALVDTNWGALVEAELHRLKGELLLAQQAREAARGRRPVFTRPSTWPAASRPKSLELRAAMSLSRLWQQQGKRDRSPTVAGSHLRLVHRGL